MLTKKRFYKLSSVSAVVVLSLASSLSAQSLIEKELLGPSQRDILDEGVQDPGLPIERRGEGLFDEPLLDQGVEGEPKEPEYAIEEDVAKKGKDADLASMINEYVDFGGAIEVEAFWERDFDGIHNSDISLEAAELDFEIKINDWSIGFLSFEWEPEDELVVVKEAFVTFGDTECIPYFATLGRLFVPFGIGTGAVVGDTLSVNDPLTIEIFETREDVIMFGYRWNGWYAAAYAFNGDTNSGIGFDDHIEHYGATIRYGIERPDYSVNFGLDYISSVFDSDNLSEVFPDALFARYAPGIAVHFKYFNNGIHFLAEYNGAFRSSSFLVEEFDDDDEEIVFEEVSLQPQAWQVEIGYVTEICCRTTYFALNYSESFDLEGFFPRRRFLATVGRWIFEDSILLALEYGRDWDYAESRGGTGNTADFVTFQMAYEW